MRVTLSAAVTADGFLDDTTSRRLVISTPEDWAAVHRLRAAHDAILVGAETLRRDNPALLIRDEKLRADRLAEGRPADLARVTVTRSGRLSPELRFFADGRRVCYVFSPRDIPDLKECATIISTNDSVSARTIVGQLERRGMERLMVEGGEQILRMFLDEGMADELRLAVNPALRVGAAGGARFDFRPAAGTPCVRENLGGMEVATYTLHPDTTNEDRKWLTAAIEQSRRCTPGPSSYCVGAVVVTPDGRSFTGYTHESSPTHHAEQEAIAKALAAGATLRGGAIYASMEPCSVRSSEPESCTQLILRHGFARVAFALYEPDCFVQCRGAQLLREAGVEVRVYPSLAEQVREVNAHLFL